MLTIKKVEEIPKRTRMARKGVKNKRVQHLVKSFYETDNRFAVIEYDEREYSTINCCAGSFRNAIHVLGYPIKVCIRVGKVYLEKNV